MSLLLDALKRAEQEKLAKQGAANDPRPSSSSAVGKRDGASAANLELQPIAGAASSPPPSPS